MRGETRRSVRGSRGAGGKERGKGNAVKKKNKEGGEGGKGKGERSVEI